MVPTSTSSRSDVRLILQQAPIQVAALAAGWATWNFRADAIEEVPPQAAEDLVEGIGRDDVDAAAAFQRVGAAETVDAVDTIAAVQHVVAAVASDGVVELGPGDVSRSPCCCSGASRKFEEFTAKSEPDLEISIVNPAVMPPKRRMILIGVGRFD